MDGSERGGPGLPGTGDRTAAGEPARPKRRRMRKLSRPNPILRAAAADAGSKSSMKGRHEDQPGALEWADMCAHRAEEKKRNAGL